MNTAVYSGSENLLSVNDIQIRPYRETDLATIAQIYNEAIALGGITMDCFACTDVDLQAIVSKFTDRETLLVIAQEQDVFGWGIIKHYSDRPGYRVCCETSTYLSSTKQGQGYGRCLQTALLAQVRVFGYHHIVAKILATNQNSIAFHQKFGFELVGIQKEIGFYRGQWHDVAIMQCILSDVPPYAPELA